MFIPYTKILIYIPSIFIEFTFINKNFITWDFTAIFKFILSSYNKLFTYLSKLTYGLYFKIVLRYVNLI